uniref:Uncharacterized protein n=1 Tax=Geladintestivirus 1 TaxID=3233133 RepID=A0AAU8MHX6_9CAUD
MEYINQIIETTINSFDFSYCITVNILTYIVIQIISEQKEVKLTTWNKRGITLLCMFIVGAAYINFGIDRKLLFNSAILAPVFWTWIAKPIINYLKNKKNN